MKRTLARSVAAAGGAAALFALFGSGSAAAIDEYKGQTYNDAATAISQAGQTPIIATKVGSFLPTGACMVTGSHNASFLDSSGNNPGGKVLLSLNCNYYFALPGVPGNSHGSTDGKTAYDAAVQQAQEEQEAAQAAQEAAAGEAAAG
ncbi:MAG: hypothetical protein ACR2JI_07595 [Mycobacterium sp.]